MVVRSQARVAQPRVTPARRVDLLDGLIAIFLAEGFLHLSVEDLARRLACSKSTLYQVAASKEQVITTVVREVFRRSAERIEVALDAVDDPFARLHTYLVGIADELQPGSPAYFADVDAFAPAHEIYDRNTRIAAERVQELVRAAAPTSTVDAAFTGAVAALVFTAIQRGEITRTTGLDDATAYRELAELVTAGISRHDTPVERTSS